MSHERGAYVHKALQQTCLRFAWESALARCVAATNEDANDAERRISLQDMMRCQSTM